MRLCDMFSRGWGSDPKDESSLLPISNSNY